MTYETSLAPPTATKATPFNCLAKGSLVGGT